MLNSFKDDPQRHREHREKLKYSVPQGLGVSYRSNNGDRILQRANTRDGDADAIAGGQRERVRRHDSGAGQQHRATRKGLRPEQVLDQLTKSPLDLIDTRLTFEHDVVPTLDLETDCPLPRIIFDGADDYPRADGAGARV